jgi:hypothetical protein
VNRQEPRLDISKATPRGASELLASGMLFEHLRADLAQVGLLGEEAAAVAVFFISLSRFRSTPLRVALEEQTSGGMKYVVKAICQLVAPGTLCLAYSEAAWQRFKQLPDHKIVMVSSWSALGWSAQCNGNVFTRSTASIQGDRIVMDGRDSVRGSFVCVSSTVDYSDQTRGRWLRLKLPEPKTQSLPSAGLDDQSRAVWLEIQELVRQRASVDILLPDWADSFLAYAARKEFAFLNVPAFLEAWKTMALLRSFQFDTRWQRAEKSGFYVADFGDLAHAGSIMRAFKERATFPSLQPIFEAVFPDGTELNVVSPLTGKGRKYKFPRCSAARRPFWENLEAAGHI